MSSSGGNRKFKVGDKVFSEAFGVGTVMSVRGDVYYRGDIYPINVMYDIFDDGRTIAYSDDGLYLNEHKDHPKNICKLTKLEKVLM